MRFHLLKTENMLIMFIWNEKFVGQKDFLLHMLNISEMSILSQEDLIQKMTNRDILPTSLQTG